MQSYNKYEAYITESTGQTFASTPFLDTWDLLIQTDIDTHTVSDKQHKHESVKESTEQTFLDTLDLLIQTDIDTHTVSDKHESVKESTEQTFTSTPFLDTWDLSVQTDDMYQYTSCKQAYESIVNELIHQRSAVLMNEVIKHYQRDCLHQKYEEERLIREQRSLEKYKQRYTTINELI